MPGLPIRNDGGVETPRTEADVELLLEAARRVEEICNAVPTLPAEVRRNRDALIEEIREAIASFHEINSDPQK